MPNYITDVGNLLNQASGTSSDIKEKLKQKKDPTSLDMTDFLQLMVVQLQNQSIDNTMDTSDMLNQMVQMQMITALTNMTDASVMSYASSLVGKEVTVGDRSSGEVVEKVITVSGTGVCDGKQVIFSGSDMYDLSSVMAVGRLPEPKPAEDVDKPAEDGSKPVEGTDKPAEGTDKPSEGGDEPVEGTDKPAEGGDEPVEGTDKPAEGGDEPVEGTDKPAEDGDKPVEGTDKPAEGGDKPVEGTDEPVEISGKQAERDGVNPVAEMERL